MRVILFLLLTLLSFGQCKLFSEEELRNQKTYVSMEDALKERKKVYKLDLSLSNLTAVPEGIDKLKCLQVLDLQDNKIEELPEKLTKLKKLQYLYLQNNYIHQLPVKMEKLKHLKKIDLRGNPISEEEVMRVQVQLPSCEILFDK